jgi:uncharacterized protein CbrC (UPF0167 family)
MNDHVSEPLPAFRYHKDPLASGSVVESLKKCKCCQRARGFIYTGPVYAEKDLGEALCPWCIADGSAAEKFEATFVDAEAFADDAPEAAMTEILERTPGFSAWQSERWPSCCGEPAAFVMPAGIAEIRAGFYQLEGSLMMHIVHEMGISGGAARQMLESFRRDQSPTVFVFKCRHCDTQPFYVDQL